MNRVSFLSGFFRPTITFLLTIGLFVASGYLVFIKQMDSDVWYQGWMGVVMMLLGFYFAQRSEQKRREDPPK